MTVDPTEIRQWRIFVGDLSGTFPEVPISFLINFRRQNDLH